MPKQDRFLSFAEVAEILGLGEGTLRNRKCGTDEIPRIRIGRRVMFSQNAVEAFMARKVREAEDLKAKARHELMAVDRRRQWMRWAGLIAARQHGNKRRTE